MAQRVLGRFGYSAQIVAVTALFCPIDRELELFRSTVGQGGDPRKLQRPFQVIALGGYDDSVAPVEGVSLLPGMTVAAHAVLLIEHPRALLDLTADQLNGHGITLPPVIFSAVERQFPMQVRRTVSREHGLLALYDHIPQDQENLPVLATPNEAQVDALVDRVAAILRT